ncbi:MAG: glycosyltransferase family 4 protein [Saccharofermentans sp.]|nr:glycosyltransferase family 4 protein [Saccharofermentans sp.]
MGSKAMNVCIFNGDMSRGGGTERITQILANALSDYCEFCITVLNLNNATGTSYYPLSDNVNIHILKSKTLFWKIIELASFLREKKIDVIIDVDIMLGMYSLPALVLSPKTKLVSWEMFNLRNDIGSKRTNLIREICLKKSAYYINQTKGDMEAFINEMPVKCPITYIYNPCEIDYSYTDYDINSKTIVTAGHFFYTKGYDLAIEVARYVFEKHSDWKWEFYGDGNKLEECKALVKEYGLEENVFFCGRTKNIMAAYKKAAMYVMTSRTEGFGLVLTEAKSCNLPTLAYDIDFGPREIIDDGVSGYLVKAFDSNKMADKICTLIENEELRKQFSVRSKDNCGIFSREQFTSRWIELLNEIS